MSKTKKLAIIAACIAVVGIILAFVGFATGGYNPLFFGPDGIYLGDSEKAATTIDEKFENVKKIDVNISAIEIEMKEGEELRVTGSFNNTLFDIQVTQEGDTLTIAEKDLNFTHWLNLGDFGNFQSKITIEYPADLKFDAIALNNNAGDIEITDLLAGKLTVNVDAGRCAIKSTVVDTADLNVDAGDLNLLDFESNGVKANVDMGRILVEGVLRGTSEFDCNAGEVEVNINAQEKYFNYDLDADLGDATLNGSSFSGVKSTSTSGNFIKLRADAGAVKLNFLPAGSSGR